MDDFNFWAREVDDLFHHVVNRSWKEVFSKTCTNISFELDKELRDIEINDNLREE